MIKVYHLYSFHVSISSRMFADVIYESHLIRSHGQMHAVYNDWQMNWSNAMVSTVLDDVHAIIIMVCVLII